MKAKLRIEKRHLVPMLALGLIAFGGIAYWRRGLSESQLLQAGRTGPQNVLSDRMLGSKPMVPISRKVNSAGEMVLRYEVVVDREALKADLLASSIAVEGTGKLTLPINVTVRKSDTPDIFGLNRPEWKFAGADVAREADVAEALWARVKSDSANVLFDHALLGTGNADGGFHVVQLAACLEEGRYDEAAAVVDNHWIWSDETTWTPLWAHRLDNEMTKFQSALDGGRIAPKMQARAGAAIHHYARNPRLAGFRREYGEMLAMRS